MSLRAPVAATVIATVAPAAGAAASATVAAKPAAAASAPGVPTRTDVAGLPLPVPALPATPSSTLQAHKPAGGKTYSDKQVSANLLAEAVTLDQQGRQDEAKAVLQRLLAANALDVQGRQMLVQLQLDTGRIDEARALLIEGQRLLPDQPNFALTLARLKVDGGDVAGAIQTLVLARSSARNEPQFHAFLAALQLRTQRYDEAVQSYLVALRAEPSNVNWLVGIGLALEGQGKTGDALEAYRRADGSGTATPDMADFLSERLARLSR